MGDTVVFHYKIITSKPFTLSKSVKGRAADSTNERHSSEAKRKLSYLIGFTVSVFNTFHEKPKE